MLVNIGALVSVSASAGARVVVLSMWPMDKVEPYTGCSPPWPQDSWEKFQLPLNQSAGVIEDEMTWGHCGSGGRAECTITKGLVVKILL